MQISSQVARSHLMTMKVKETSPFGSVIPSSTLLSIFLLLLLLVLLVFDAEVPELLFALDSEDTSNDHQEPSCGDEVVDPKLVDPMPGTTATIPVRGSVKRSRDYDEESSCVVKRRRIIREEVKSYFIYISKPITKTILYILIL